MIRSAIVNKRGSGCYVEYRRFCVSGCSLATNASAQLASQTALVGTVTDSGNLVVPGAQVVAVNVGTKDTYEATTNAEGYYNIQFVRTGTYDITVTMAGFQTFKATGVEVANNQVVRTNAVLKVGGVDRIGERRSQGRRCSTPTAPSSRRPSASGRSSTCR